MKLRIARVAPIIAATIVAASAATIVAANMLAAEPAPRTVILGIAGQDQTPEEWTAEVIRNGWAATDAADRARACSATPDQLRAAAPHTSYDPARYRVETAITVLGHLCAGK